MSAFSRCWRSSISCRFTAKSSVYVSLLSLLLVSICTAILFKFCTMIVSEFQAFKFMVGMACVFFSSASKRSHLPLLTSPLLELIIFSSFSLKRTLTQYVRLFNEVFKGVVVSLSFEKIYDLEDFLDIFINSLLQNIQHIYIICFYCQMPHLLNVFI